MNLELFIDGLRVDLAGAKPTLNRIFFDGFDKDANPGSYSFDFDVPATPNNLKVFGSTGYVDGENYENQKTREAVLMADGVEIVRGLALYKETVKDLKGRVDSFSIALIYDNGDWKSKIKNAKLRDLDLGDVVWNQTNVDASATWTSDDANYTFPLISYGAFVDGGGGADHIPAFFVKPVLDKIFEDAGVTNTSAFKQTDFFKRVILPFTNENLVQDTGFATTHIIDVEKNSPQSFSEVGAANFYSLTASWTTVNFPTENSDPGNRWATNTYTAGTALRSLFQVSLEVSFDADQDGEYVVGWFVNGSLVYRDFGGTFTPGSTITQSFTSPQLNLNSGDTVQLKFKWLKFTGASNNVELQVGSTLVNFVGDIAEFNTTFDLASQLPDITQLQFVEAVFGLFNVRSGTTKNGILEWEPRDDFFSATAKDWTSYIDLGKEVKVASLINESPQAIRYRGKDDSGDAVVEILRNTYGSFDGDLRTISTLNFGETELLREALFSETYMASIDTDSGTFNVPVLWKDVDATLSAPDRSFKFAPRVLYYEGTSGGSTDNLAFSYKRTGSTSNSVAWNTYSTGLGLVDRYFRSDILTAKRGKSVECSAVIPLFEFIDLRKSDRVAIDGVEYIVASIQDYDISTGRCKLSLITWHEDTVTVTPAGNVPALTGSEAFETKTKTDGDEAKIIGADGRVYTISGGGGSGLTGNGVPNSSTYWQTSAQLASVALNTTATNKFLRQVSSLAPTFEELTTSDISGNGFIRNQGTVQSSAQFFIDGQGKAATFAATASGSTFGTTGTVATFGDGTGTATIDVKGLAGSEVRYGYRTSEALRWTTILDNTANRDWRLERYDSGSSFQGAAIIVRNATGAMILENTLTIGSISATAANVGSLLASDGGEVKTRTSSALSVLGRSANSTGIPADIAATASTKQVLRVSGTALGFGTIDSTYISDFTAAARSSISIAAGSTAYLGYNSTTGELSIKALAITTVTVDTVETSFSAWVAANYTGTEFQEGDVIILTNLGGNSPVQSWIHNGGTAGDATDFTKLEEPNLTDSYIRALFSAGSGISYDNGTGIISHSDTSSVSDLTTTGAQVIDTLTFDTFGHVLTRTTRNLTASDVGGVPTSRTLTINGTANQVTVTGGTQDLSANRTWTASIPSTFIAPGSIQATTTVSGTTFAASASGSTFGTSGVIAKFGNGLAGNAIIDIDGVTGDTKGVALKSGGITRFFVFSQNDGYHIGRYDNSGVFVADAVTISRTTGATTLENTLTIGSIASASGDVLTVSGAGLVQKQTATQIVTSGGGVPTSRTITVAGTTNQITSSAGAQDLSANRTWTLSIPSTFIAPGSIEATTTLKVNTTSQIIGDAKFGVAGDVGVKISGTNARTVAPSNDLDCYILNTVSGGSYPFNANGNLVFLPRSSTGGAGQMVFMTGETPAVRMSILSTGIGTTAGDFVTLAGSNNNLHRRTAAQVLSDISAVGGRGNGGTDRVAVWSNTTTLTSDSIFTYNGGTLLISGTSARIDLHTTISLIASSGRVSSTENLLANGTTDPTGVTGSHILYTRASGVWIANPDSVYTRIGGYIANSGNNATSTITAVSGLSVIDNQKLAKVTLKDSQTAYIVFRIGQKLSSSSGSILSYLVWDTSATGTTGTQVTNSNTTTGTTNRQYYEYEVWITRISNTEVNIIGKPRGNTHASPNNFDYVGITGLNLDATDYFIKFLANFTPFSVDTADVQIAHKSLRV